MAQTPEYKAAQKIMDMFNVYDIDTVRIAGFITARGSDHVQVKLFQMALKLFYNWALKFDAGEYTMNSEMENVVVYSKRLVEFHERYGGGSI